MPLTIVTYHYVRDLGNSRYPDIKGRDLAEFKGQLDYIGRHYEVVSTNDVIGAFKGATTLPENACWLTFDDGYLDHFINVLPQLYDRKMHGAFFPPVNAVVHGELLDVNKAHFIRAAQPDTAAIIDEIKTYIGDNQARDNIQPFNAYWDAHAKPGRYDTADVMFIKKVLQHALPEAERNALVDDLFQKFVSIDQKAFAGELYMSEDQLRMMIQCGMYIGGHGAKHYWLDRLNETEQVAEIAASLEFLRGLGAPTTDWVMCYPYGASDEALRALLSRRGCALALTIESGIADVAEDDPLLLRRRDTNELPLS
jgi:peptidoglycan/xylan/chitin deacetylase (PgdA/CDA1 family)